MLFHFVITSLRLFCALKSGSFERIYVKEDKKNRISLKLVYVSAKNVNKTLKCKKTLDNCIFMQYNMVTEKQAETPQELRTIGADEKFKTMNIYKELLKMKTPKKIVLAYSGGLDTSIIIPWLKETYEGCEVIAVSGNVSVRLPELEGLEEKAKKTGASKLYIEDLTKEYVEDYIFPCLKAGAKYEDYLLGTSHAVLASQSVSLK